MIYEHVSSPDRWGMPPRRGEGDRPPVPQPQPWFAFDCSIGHEDVNQFMSRVRAFISEAEIASQDWYWANSNQGVRLVFRNRADAELMQEKAHG